jgi:hypothetical protein
MKNKLWNIKFYNVLLFLHNEYFIAEGLKLQF